MKFADHHLHFIKNLRIEVNLPAGVEVLFPFNKVEVWEINQLFYQKYYHDNFPRVMIFGINPGRLGGGVTGIPFTDPIRLANFCGIENTLEAKGELSSTFIYEMISAYGGTEKFYQRFYFTAVSPLGFIKDHKNLNYYDISNWKSLLEKYIVQGIQKQLSFGVERHVAFCLGQGTNFAYLNELNRRHNFFKEIIPLPHPRWILQYKRKLKDDFIDAYCEALNSI